MTYLSKRTENQKNGEIILSTYADNKDNVQMSFEINTLFRNINM